MGSLSFLLGIFPTQGLNPAYISFTWIALEAKLGLRYGCITVARLHVTAASPGSTTRGEKAACLLLLQLLCLQREYTCLQFRWLLESSPSSPAQALLPWVQWTVRYSKTAGVVGRMNSKTLPVMQEGFYFSTTSLRLLLSVYYCVYKSDPNVCDMAWAVFLKVDQLTSFIWL